jgi:hypothetical protein
MQLNFRGFHQKVGRTNYTLALTIETASPPFMQTKKNQQTFPASSRWFKTRLLLLIEL